MSDPVTLEQVIAALAPFAKQVDLLSGDGDEIMGYAPIGHLRAARTVHAALVAANTLPPTLAERSKEALRSEWEYKMPTPFSDFVQCAGCEAKVKAWPADWATVTHTHDCLISQLDRVIAGGASETPAPSIEIDTTRTVADYLAESGHDPQRAVDPLTVLKDRTPAPIDTRDAVIEAAARFVSGGHRETCQSVLIEDADYPCSCGADALGTALRAHREAHRG